MAPLSQVDLIKGQRQLLHEYEFTEVDPDTFKERGKMRVIVFNDSVLLASKMKKKKKYKHEFVGLFGFPETNVAMMNKSQDIFSMNIFRSAHQQHTNSTTSTGLFTSATVTNTAAATATTTSDMHSQQHVQFMFRGPMVADFIRCFRTTKASAVVSREEIRHRIWLDDSNTELAFRVFPTLEEYQLSGGKVGAVRHRDLSPR